MPGIKTNIGVLYTIEEFKTLKGTAFNEWASSQTASLGRGMSSPYVDGHVLTFVRWAIVLPERKSAGRTESTPKTVMVFKDETANTEIVIWLSTFSKEWVNRPKPANAEDEKRSAIGWNEQPLSETDNRSRGYNGGDMRVAVIDVINASMTNDALMSAVEPKVKGIKWQVKRVPYNYATVDKAGRNQFGLTDFVEFNKVAE